MTKVGELSLPSWMNLFVAMGVVVLRKFSLTCQLTMYWVLTHEHLPDNNSSFESTLDEQFNEPINTPYM